MLCFVQWRTWVVKSHVKLYRGRMPTEEVKRRIIVVSPGILLGGDTALNQLFQLFSRHEWRQYCGTPSLYLTSTLNMTLFRSGLMLIWNGMSLSMGWSRISGCPQVISGSQTFWCTTGEEDLHNAGISGYLCCLDGDVAVPARRSMELIKLMWW